MNKDNMKFLKILRVMAFQRAKGELLSMLEAVSVEDKNYYKIETEVECFINEIDDLLV